MRDDYRTFGTEIRLDDKDDQMKLRIYSLLSQPANLSFVRVFKTGRFGLKSTMLMDEFLPLLRKDFMIKFSFCDKFKDYFPTPLQVQFLLNRQKNLRNLKFHSGIVTWLEEFLEKNKKNQSTFLQSFIKLAIGSSIGTTVLTSSELCWPLKNLDLSHLQSLLLCGTWHNRVTQIIDLFASQTFINLAKLSLVGIVFEKPLALTNMPSLKSLVINYCGNHGYRRDSLPLVFPNISQLQSLTFCSSGRIEFLTHLLTQIKNLEKLVIGVPFEYLNTDQAVVNFISVIMLHKNTLRQLKFRMRLKSYERTMNVLKQNPFFLNKIQTY